LATFSPLSLSLSLSLSVIHFITISQLLALKLNFYNAQNLILPK
jgi:hypothetical protein